MKRGRPQYRSQCLNGIRPCPWVSCKHHMIWAIGRIERLSNDQIIEKIKTIPETCTLDVADQGGMTVRNLAVVMGVGRSRIIQMTTGDKTTIGAIERLRHVSRRHILEPFI